MQVGVPGGDSQLDGDKVIRPHEVVRALGGSPLMIRTAKGHLSWRSFWNSVDRVSWLGDFAVQVGIHRDVALSVRGVCMNILANAVSVDREAWDELEKGAFRGALAGVPEQQRFVVEAVHTCAVESRNHFDALPDFLSAVGMLLRHCEVDSLEVELLNGVRRELDYEEFLGRLRQSPWLCIERPGRIVRGATLASPLLSDGRTRVRTTSRQKVSVVDTWLVVETRDRELHHPLRFVERLDEG
mgnify:FL=1